MILLRLSAEGADDETLTALLERLGDEALLYAVIKRLHVQVQTYAKPIEPQPAQINRLDEMRLG